MPPLALQVASNDIVSPNLPEYNLDVNIMCIINLPKWALEYSMQTWTVPYLLMP